MSKPPRPQTPNPPDIGTIIRKRRQSCGHSLRTAAALAGVDRGAVDRIERGITPTADAAFRLGRLYRVDLNRFARETHAEITPVAASLLDRPPHPEV